MTVYSIAQLTRVVKLVNGQAVRAKVGIINAVNLPSAILKKKQLSSVLNFNQLQKTEALTG